MNGKVIFEGKSTKGINYSIRYPEETDVHLMHEYFNKLSSEKTFNNLQGEKTSLKEEKEYLKDQLKRIDIKQSVQLVVIANSKIIGVSSIDLGEGASSHEGVLGISILEEYRNSGIGGKLLKLTINEALENLPKLKIITLTVFEENTVADKIYKKLGFKEYGKLPDGILYKGLYQDRIHMYKMLD